jgi:hypothetical protein
VPDFIPEQHEDGLKLGRAVWYNGFADLRTILQDEMSGKYINRMQGEERGSMLVIGKMCNQLN